MQKNFKGNKNYLYPTTITYFVVAIMLYAKHDWCLKDNITMYVHTYICTYECTRMNCIGLVSAVTMTTK